MDIENKLLNVHHVQVCWLAASSKKTFADKSFNEQLKKTLQSCLLLGQHISFCFSLQGRLFCRNVWIESFPPKLFQKCNLEVKLFLTFPPKPLKICSFGELGLMKKSFWSKCSRQQMSQNVMFDVAGISRKAYRTK